MPHKLFLGLTSIILIGAGCARGGVPAQPAPAQWQTYQSDKYAFEIKYPNDWIFDVNLTGDKISIKPPGEIVPILDISLVPESYSKVLAREQETFNKWKKESTEEPSGKVSDIVLAGKSAKEFLYAEPIGTIRQTIILPGNNQTIIINSYKGSDLDLILATFKFTE